MNEFQDEIVQIPFIQSEDGDAFYSNVIDLDMIDHNIESTDLETDEYETNDFEDEELNEIESDEISERIGISNNTSEQPDEYETEPLPPHRRCLSHLLNLLGNDFENTLSDKPKELLMATLNKLQSIWVYPRKSSAAKKYSQEILGCVLPIPCPTRWNSKYDAVNKVLNLGFDKMNNYVDALKKNLKSARHLSKLDKEDWVMINIYVRVMRPVAVALDRLQGEKECGQGFILPTLFTMKHQLKSLEGGNILKPCRDNMLRAIDKRFGSYFQIDNYNKEMLLSSASSPRFRTDFIEKDVDVVFVKDLLISGCKILQSDANSGDFEDSTEDTMNESTDFFVSFASRRDTRRRSIEIIIEEEVNRFLDDHRKDLKILDEYPNVRNVFLRHNTTLAASAAVERVFSQSNIIFTPRRNRLSADNFERLMLVKLNRKPLLKYTQVIVI